MARAKRTDRADARRRTRHTHPADDGSAGTQPTEAVTRSGSDRPPTARPSITAAFRNAYHPANIREDLAALPRLLTTKAFLIPIGLIFAGSMLVILDASNPVAVFAFQTLVLPPAMAPIFIAGFFATRASYLLGGIIGLIDFAVYAGFLLAIVPATGGTATPAEIQEQVLAAAAVGPSGGILFAAAAAWYRRFLALSNASAARARQERARAAASKKGR